MSKILPPVRYSNQVLFQYFGNPESQAPLSIPFPGPASLKAGRWLSLPPLVLC